LVLLSSLNKLDLSELVNYIRELVIFSIRGWIVSDGLQSQIRLNVILDLRLALCPRLYNPDVIFDLDLISGEEVSGQLDSNPS